MTQAHEFDKKVKEIHRLPPESVWLDYGLEAAVFEPDVWNRRALKVTQLQFKDGSFYNVGQPEQGPHEKEEEEE